MAKYHLSWGGDAPKLYLFHFCPDLLLHKWCWDRALNSPGRRLRSAHKCFPLLQAGRRGNRFCHRTWRVERVWSGNPITFRQGKVGKEERGAKRGSGDMRPAAGQELLPDLTCRGEASGAARGRGKEEETLAMEEEEQKVANCSLAQEPPAAGSQAGSLRLATTRRAPPRPPPRLPPGSGPAWSRRLARPRPLLLFLFLVPGRTSGSEEPGEAVPGGAALSPAAGHFPRGPLARGGLQGTA